MTVSVVAKQKAVTLVVPPNDVLWHTPFLRFPNAIPSHQPRSAPHRCQPVPKAAGTVLELVAFTMVCHRRIRPQEFRVTTKCCRMQVRSNNIGCEHAIHAGTKLDSRRRPLLQPARFEKVAGLPKAHHKIVIFSYCFGHYLKRGNVEPLIIWTVQNRECPPLKTLGKFFKRYPPLQANTMSQGKPGGFSRNVLMNRGAYVERFWPRLTAMYTTKTRNVGDSESISHLWLMAFPAWFWRAQRPQPRPLP